MPGVVRGALKRASTVALKGLVAARAARPQQEDSSIDIMYALDWTADSWVARLLVNLAGYASVILPGYLCILYIRRTGYLERTGCCTALFIRCLHTWYKQLIPPYYFKF